MLTCTQHEPLRPELAAVLGGWPLSQLTKGVGGSSCVSLCGVVAVLGCCIVPVCRCRDDLVRVQAGYGDLTGSDKRVHCRVSA
jgi:hypothetical protein